MSDMAVPYIITDDLEIVFSRMETKGMIPPSKEILRKASSGIEAALSEVFPKVEIIPAGRIAAYLTKEISLSRIPVISLTGLLDDKLIAAALHFSRSVQSLKGEYISIGMMPRYQSDQAIDVQFDRVAEKIGAISKDVALIDDVVFSGGTVCFIADEMERRGIKTNKVVASVVIRSALPILKERGIDVEADVIYDEVVDEVCMRDFIVGAPGGGRNVISSLGVYESAPYILPFGDVSGWASVPKKFAEDFSRASISTAVELWQEIDRANCREIQVGELAKPILSWKDSDGITSNLKKCLG